MTLEELERELRAERPQPDPDFARRLDEWAAADFPADRGLGPRVGSRRGGSLQRIRDRLTAIPPRRMLLPVGALATAVVVIGVAISQNGGSGDDSSQAVDSRTTGAGSAGALGASAESAAPAESAAAPDTDSQLSVPDAATAADGIARGADTRIVDATARLTLGAKADEVQDVSNRVVDVTDRYDGVVLDSQVTTDQGGARAAFELEIPYRQLDAALTELSGLADVISRTEGGQDITSKAVRAQKELAGVLDQIAKARTALIAADTHEERLVLKSQIASLNASADAYRSELNGVKRQGRFATVDVEVTSNGQHSDDGGGGWSLGDALDDSGRVLEVIAGIGLVTLAVMLPLSLVLILGNHAAPARASAGPLNNSRGCSASPPLPRGRYYEAQL
jgi:hypothetical protein